MFQILQQIQIIITKTMSKLKPKLLGSSADPTKIAMTIKGVLVAIIPIAIYFGMNNASTDLPALGDAIIGAVQAVTAAIAAVMFVYGIARKVYYAFKK